MFVAQVESYGVGVVFFLLGAGALFGFVAAMVVWWIWWAEKEAVLENKGERLRDRIRRRFRYDRKKRESSKKE